MLFQESNASTMLTWVRTDLDKHLDQVRTQIEHIASINHIGDGVDSTADNLTQLKYTFDTLLLQGASKLTDEMITLCERLRNGRVRDQGKAFAALMDAIVVVPSYLDRLQAGHHDLPILLLPVINELRSAYDANIVSESTLFSPDLDVEVPELEFDSSPPDTQFDEPAPVFLELMKRQYETSLLQWLQGQDKLVLLEPIQSVCETLSKRLEGLQTKRLWWIASIVVNGLLDDVTENDLQLRRLFARLHLTIKMLAEKGEAGLDLQAVDELSQALLFHIAQAKPGNADVELLRERYKLNELVPDRGVLLRARGAITGRNRELYISLGKAVRDELSLVKNALDLELRTGEVEQVRRQQSHDALLRLKDTLEMMGLGDSAKSIAALMPAFVASASSDSHAEPDDALNGISSESLLMTLAEQLIQVESVLDEQIATLGEPILANEDTGNIELPVHEQIRIRSHLLNEAVVSIHQVEDAVRRHFDGSPNADYLSGLEHVAGAMELIGEVDTASLALKLRAALDNLLRLARHESQIDSEKLEAVTDAVAAFELYLAACRDQQHNREHFLDIIRNRLERLPVGEIVVVRSAETAASESVAAEKDLQAELHSEQETVPQSLDDELLGVFLEEYETVKVMLDELIPEWAQKQDNSELMVEIRRGFHTLKGSGRMVGAYELGDFAWHVEDMLNNLLDGNIENFHDVATLLNLANAVLPAMHQRLLQQPTVLGVEGLNAISKIIDEAGTGQSPTWSSLDRLLPADLLSLVPDNQSLTPLPETDSPEPHAYSEAGAETEAEVKVEVEIGAEAEMEAEAEAEAELEIEAELEAGAETEVEVETEAEAAAEVGVEAEAEVEVEVETEAATAAEAVVEAQIDAEAGAEVKPPADEVLNDLICTEFSSNLETLTALMDEISRNRNTVAEEHHIIAAHTIAGTAALMPLAREVELAKALEGFLIAQRSSRKAFSDSAMWTIATSLVHLSACLAIHQGDPDAELSEDEDSQIEQLHALAGEYEVIPERAKEPEHVPETVPAADTSGAQAGIEKTGTSVDGDEISGQQMPEAGESDAVDSEILVLFLEEASEILGHCDSLLNSWRDNLPNLNIVQNLQREIHTFKGGARMSGVSSMGDLSHAMESLLEQIACKQLPPTVSAIEALEQGCDHLTGWVEEARSGTIPKTGTALEVFEERAAKLLTEHSPAATVDDEVSEELVSKEPVAEEQAADSAAVQPAGIQETSDDKPAVAAKDKARKADPTGKKDTAVIQRTTRLGELPIETMELPESVATEAPARDSSGDAAGPQQIRVNADLLDSLVNSAGEVSIFRSRLELQVNQQRETLKEFDETVSRLREQFRKLEIETETQIRSRYQQESNNASEEFDPLELDRFSSMQQLSRSLSESVSDLLNLQELLDESTRKSEALLVQQSRVSTELQEGLLQTRMVHFATIAPRLRRVVRAAASETGKKALLHLRMTDGGDQLDRNVLERITAPLEHLLRNAIAHGIESPKQRRQLNKPAEGAVNVTVSSEATEFVIRVEDDGGGLDHDAIRNRAIESGLIEKGATPAPHQLLQFILQSGFSTSKTVTGLSGRGVGMDVVNSEIKQIGGSIEIDSEPGKGSRFTIRIPFTLAVMQAIGVVAGEHRYLIPLASVAGVARMLPDDYRKLHESESPVYEFAGDPFRVLELEPLLGEPSSPLGDDTVSLLLVKAGERRAAFRVPELLGHREIVIKPVGPQISSVPGILGGTITGDGQVVVIIDTGPLIRQALMTDARPALPLASGDERRKQLLAMVVDDSITMRKVTSRVLESRDFEVITARDGVDATEQMQERVPDLLLLDVEMPRMDGYQVAEYVRADARLRDIPIIMITSRGGEKHRERGHRAGANAYVTKPYKESDLIDEVRQLLRHTEHQEGIHHG